MSGPSGIWAAASKYFTHGTKVQLLPAPVGADCKVGDKLTFAFRKTGDTDPSYSYTATVKEVDTNDMPTAYEEEPIIFIVPWLITANNYSDGDTLTSEPISGSTAAAEMTIKILEEGDEVSVDVSDAWKRAVGTQADWGAASGDPAEVLNKPPITYDVTDWGPPWGLYHITKIEAYPPGDYGGDVWIAGDHFYATDPDDVVGFGIELHNAPARIYGYDNSSGSSKYELIVEGDLKVIHTFGADGDLTVEGNISASNFKREDVGTANEWINIPAEVWITDGDHFAYCTPDFNRGFTFELHGGDTPTLWAYDFTKTPPEYDLKIASNLLVGDAGDPCDLTVSGNITAANLAQADWDATSGPAEVLHKPAIHTDPPTPFDPGDGNIIMLQNSTWIGAGRLKVEFTEGNWVEVSGAPNGLYIDHPTNVNQYFNVKTEDDSVVMSSATSENLFDLNGAVNVNNTSLRVKALENPTSFLQIRTPNAAATPYPPPEISSSENKIRLVDTSNQDHGWTPATKFVEFDFTGTDPHVSTDTGNIEFGGAVALGRDPISDLEAATKQYVDAEVADKVAASQFWLPAVETQADLPTITDTSKTWLCRVRATNNVYQCVAGQTTWVLYSVDTDFVDPDQLATALADYLPLTGKAADSALLNGKADTTFATVASGQDAFNAARLGGALARLFPQIRGDLTLNQNLDDVTEYGVYCSPVFATAQSLVNRPPDMTGNNRLIVVEVAKSTRYPLDGNDQNGLLEQRATIFDSSLRIWNKWTRVRQVGTGAATWGPWKTDGKMDIAAGQFPAITSVALLVANNWATEYAVQNTDFNTWTDIENIGAVAGSSVPIHITVQPWQNVSAKEVTVKVSTTGRMFRRSLDSAAVWRSAKWMEVATDQTTGVQLRTQSASSGDQYIRIASFNLAVGPPTASVVRQVRLKVRLYRNSLAYNGEYIVSVTLLSAPPATTASGFVTYTQIDVQGTNAQFSAIKDDANNRFDIWCFARTNFPVLTVEQDMANTTVQSVTLLPDGDTAWQVAMPTGFTELSVEQTATREWAQSWVSTKTPIFTTALQTTSAAQRWIKIASVTYPPMSGSTGNRQVRLEVNTRNGGGTWWSQYIVRLRFTTQTTALLGVVYGTVIADVMERQFGNGRDAVDFTYVFDDTARVAHIYASALVNNLGLSVGLADSNTQDQPAVTILPDGTTWLTATPFPAMGTGDTVLTNNVLIPFSAGGGNLVTRLPYGSSSVVMQPTLRDYILAQGNISFEQTIINFGTTRFSDLGNLTTLTPALNSYCHLKVERSSTDNAFMATVTEGGNIATPRRFFRTAGGSAWQNDGWTELARIINGNVIVGSKTALLNPSPTVAATEAQVGNAIADMMTLVMDILTNKPTNPLFTELNPWGYWSFDLIFAPLQRGDVLFAEPSDGGRFMVIPGTTPASNNVNADRLPFTVPGKFGKALAFFGAGTIGAGGAANGGMLYLDPGPNEENSFHPLGDFTICYWVKETVIGGGRGMTFCNWETGGIGLQTQANGAFIYQAYSADVQMGTTGGAYRTLTAPAGTFPQDGEWHHVRVAYTAADKTHRVFIDGHNIADPADTGTIDPALELRHVDHGPAKVMSWGTVRLGLAFGANPDQTTGRRSPWPESSSSWAHNIQLDEIWMFQRAITDAEYTKIFNNKS